MRHNTSRIDRILRVALAIIILAAGFYYQSLWGLIGIIPLVSGLSGFCPLYSIFGISTCHYEIVSGKPRNIDSRG